MTQIEVPESIAPAVQVLVNAATRDYAYVLCVESPVKDHATATNKISATNRHGIEAARLLARFAREAREDAK